jgi:hypothetical protein
MSKILTEVLESNRKYTADFWGEKKADFAPGPIVCHSDLYGRADGPCQVCRPARG